MTETPPPPSTGDRIEPVDIQLEMQRSFLDYAMSVIVARALPDVRDGLKPVHRRVLYAMYDSGYRPDRGHVKCSRVVGDVMGNYHPHGDTSIYDTLVRLSQPWSMRAPLIDGQGNFGSPGNDPAAAMRYCVVGDTLVVTPDGDTPIAELVPDAASDSTTEVDFKVIGRDGAPVRVSAFHHSGEHPVLTVTAGGHSVTATENHPLLVVGRVHDVPTLMWKLLGEISHRDVLVLRRPESDQQSWASALPMLPDITAAYRSDPARHLPDDGGDPRQFSLAPVSSIVESGVQAVYSLRVDSTDHAFLTNGFVSHNTEARLTPLAMDMLRDIDEDTVDFKPNYDGRSQEPVVLPSRIPNLLVNGGGGIAVGMATNLPPHNLREVAAGVTWALDHPDATSEELLEQLMRDIPGPDFPTRGLIVGRDGIEEAYRTGRGSIRMRAVVTVEEDSRGRTILVITELPYQVNPDNLVANIADLAKEAKVGGIADINDESSDRIGMRIVVTLKRDAVAKVVLNNLYKHTQLQTTFGVTNLAIVDGVPRTLRLDQIVSYYVTHQVEVIVRRTQYRLRKAEERAHILRALLKALDALDAVIALIRGAASADAARTGLMELLDIDEIQAVAILDLQLRRLAALERLRIQEEAAEIEAKIADFKDILAKPGRQRQIIRDELNEIVDKYGDGRRTRLIAYDGDMSMEDLIAAEDVVVTITRTGYAKRTKTDLYRSQRRGGKGVQGAALKTDDLVAHFFVCSTHDWILFFTNKGRVYRTKTYDLPEANRNARGQHVANLLAFQPDEHIAEVITIKNYEVAPYLVLATKSGLVKKTKLTEFDSNRSGGIVAINLREEDELIDAALISPDDDLLLVSKLAQSIRFKADDDTLRPMGRATSGVIGMRFSGVDELLAMEVVQDGMEILIATDGGFAKRTKVEEYPIQGRGGKGVLTARIVSTRGALVGAMSVRPEDEVYAITSDGVVIRTSAGQVRRAQRQTMGVRLMNLPEGVNLVSIARNADEPEEQE
ncbi:DNA gyrase subunit A [Jatrophihabitans lederbergiae]|uniref:DNA topoisomerase (ATP-hydrolyzing) n=1 Tax=Jatrophihabitans lederbergiae TaxID=3075547 RepID=A0ABU2JBV7_9ACTN|nr:DNA gyrase subunit A [Jatrophihabitans sp. DSM 44399]MDT0262236.1 DNA gyrase subunit A [Jatrophihabitans sp. DSM 44399]